MGDASGGAKRGTVLIRTATTERARVGRRPVREPVRSAEARDRAAAGGTGGAARAFGTWPAALFSLHAILLPDAEPLNEAVDWGETIGGGARQAAGAFPQALRRSERDSPPEPLSDRRVPHLGLAEMRISSDKSRVSFQSGALISDPEPPDLVHRIAPDREHLVRDTKLQSSVLAAVRRMRKWRGYGSVFSDVADLALDGHVPRLPAPAPARARRSRR